MFERDDLVNPYDSDIYINPYEMFLFFCDLVPNLLFGILLPGKGAALAILDWWYTSTMVRDPNGDPVSLQPVNVEILLPEILEENGDGETRIVKSCCKLLSIWKTTCYRPLAVAFINARSALDHLFWLLGTQRIEAHFVRPILWHGAISSCLKLFVNGGRVSPSLNHQSHFLATQATCLSRI